jgi:hypothetical protein
MNALSQATRLLRTTQRLHWSQVAWRMRRVAVRRLGRRERSDHVDIGLEDCAPLDLLPRIPVAHGLCRDLEETVSLASRGEIRQLHRTFSIGRDRKDWRLGPQSHDRLGAITLHYHAWLYRLAEASRSDSPRAAEAESLFQEYLLDWLQNADIRAPGAEDLAWNSYAIATRLGWWVRSIQVLGDDFLQSRSRLAVSWLSSMWRQARHLRANLEWDLRANHLLRDLVGLAWAGRFFQGAEPQEWLRTAERLAIGQAAEQTLADGGHFERSPFYHLEVMDDWLALSLLLKEPQAIEAARRTWRAMAEYVAWLRHPDGVIPQFNDGAASRPEERLRLAPHLGEEVVLSPRRGGRRFADSGVVVWHGDPWSVFFDVGEVGPGYQPGHAHADTLTIECSFDGRRLFVDPGCFAYDHDERRRYDRSTAAHNTVCIDGIDSSEVWHIFRVGRRARPIDVTAEVHVDGLVASAAHTGYDHLPGRPRHTRRVTVHDGGALEIIDRIDGRGVHRLEGGYLLAPGWQASPAPGGWRVACEHRDVRVHIAGPPGMTLEMQARPYHPDYGLEETTTRLAWRHDGALPVEVRTRVESGTEGAV